MRKIIVLCYFLVSFPCETIFQSQCNRLEFLCKNGACVELINVCDGVENCQDGSDETAERCSSIYCPAYAFRCAYGACVEANAVCDGTEDCADGSDESPLRCGVGHTGATTNANNNPQRLPVSGDSGAPNGGCIFDSLANVIAHYESSQNEALKPGETVADFSSITYKCQPKQVLVGSADNFCDNGKWRNQHPTCTKYCDSSVITGVTIQASCEYNNVGIPCHASVLLPGTRATISCQIGYQKPDRIVQEILVCGRNGEWDYHPFRCEQVCGVEPPISTPFVVGGATINNTFVPWHVGIYYNGDGKYDQMCGGTIVNAKVVVSVAEAKKKWQGLRDVFRREFRKYQKSGQEAPDEFSSSWPFFDQMLFLSDIMMPRDLKGSVTSVENLEKDEDFSALEAEKPDESVSQSSSPFVERLRMGPPATTLTKHKVSNENLIQSKKAKTKKIEGSDSPIERAKLQLFSENNAIEGDSNYQFLLSLFPYLKKVPDDRKLAVRNKLQQVLIDEDQYNSSSRQTPSQFVYTDTLSSSSWSSEAPETPPSEYIPNFAAST